MSDLVEEVFLTLPTACDLSEASYEDMREFLQKEYQKMMENPITDNWFLLNGTASVVLKVSIWDAPIALELMVKYRNCDVLVTKCYRENEHSISCRFPSKKITVYSPGA